MSIKPLPLIAGLVAGLALSWLVSCDTPLPTVPPVVCDTLVAGHQERFEQLAPMFLLPPDLWNDAAHCRAVHGGEGSDAETAAGRMVAECAKAAGVAQYAMAYHLAERHGLPLPALRGDVGCFAALRDALGREIDGE